MSMRPRAVTALVALALLPEPTAAATDRGLCGSSGLTRNSVPSDDFDACGLTEHELWGFQTNLYIEKKCTNAACQRIFAFLNANYPNECLVSGGQTILLHASVLEPLAKSCAALATRTPAPVPAPVPAPRITRAPVAPVPASPSTPPASLPSLSPPPSPESTQAPSQASSLSSSPSTAPSGSTSPTTDETEEDAVPQGSIRDEDLSAIEPSAAPIETQQNSTSRDQAPKTRDRTPVPASTTVNVANSSDPNSSSTPWVIGMIAAVLVVAAACGGVFYRRKRRDHNVKADHTHYTSASTETTSGDMTSQDIVNMDGSLSTQHHRKMEELLRDDTLLETWRLFAKQIREKKFLGKGSHAFVHLVELPNGSLLASKRLAQDQATPTHFAQLLGEVHIVSTLSHPSIVEFKGVAWTNAMDFQVLFEYMRGGDLRQYLDQVPRPSQQSGSTWNRRKLQMALSIAEGLAYAHSFTSPLVHRDLKSRNVLLTEDLRAKISDFGVSRFQSENDTMTTGVGTNRWLAPEVLVGGGAYNEKCDIYSFGVVMTELDTHQVPLEKEIAALRSSTIGENRSRSELWVLREISNGTLRPSISASAPQGLREFVAQCLSLDPNDRPVALELSYRLRKLIEKP